MVHKSWFKLIAFALSFTFAVPAAAQRTVAPSSRVKRNVVVRAAPSTESQPLDRLEPGEQAVFQGEVPGWFEVQLPDGQTGYVSKVWAVLSGASEAEYRIHAVDVGTGLAVFVEGPDFALLYDGGSNDDKRTGPNNRLIAYLKAARPGLQTIDHVILSHPHRDHVELLPDVFDAYQVRHVWDSGAINPTCGYLEFLTKVSQEPGVTYHNAIGEGGTHEAQLVGDSCSGTVRLAQGPAMSKDPVQLGSGARMTILHRDANRHHDPNENSVVVRLDLGRRRILLTGDAEGGERQHPAGAPHPESVEAELLKCCRSALKADVLFVGHHGSMTSSRSVFLDAIGAKTFVVSSGPFPYKSVRLPDAVILQELRQRGDVFETNEGDAACRVATAKIGSDNDNSPGGCSNVLLRIDGSGAISTAYHRIAD